MHVSAEGGEVPNPLDRLRGMECECGQGFLFHHPMGSAAGKDLLATATHLVTHPERVS